MALLISRERFPVVCEYADKTSFENISSGRFRGYTVENVLNHLSQNALEYLDEYLEAARTEHGWWQLPWVLAKETKLETSDEAGEPSTLEPLVLHDDPILGKLDEDENEYVPYVPMASVKPLQDPRVRSLSVSSQGSQHDPDYDYPLVCLSGSPSSASPRYKTPPKGSGGPPPLPPKDKPVKKESQYMILDLSNLNPSDYAVVARRKS